VDGCWNVGWFWSEVCGKPSSGCRCWLTLLADIVRVLSGLEHSGHQMLGSNSRRLPDSEHG
jgi:hypothetical protein